MPARTRVADALEAERARTRAWLHDTLLQQLEYIAAGGYADDADPRELMRVAAGAATDLRAFVEGDEAAGAGTLVERLRRVIEDEQELATHEIRLVFGEVDGTLEAPSSPTRPARRSPTSASTPARRRPSSPATSPPASAPSSCTTTASASTRRGPSVAPGCARASSAAWSVPVAPR